MKLLVVDSQPLIRSGLRTIISNENKEYYVYEASSISDAISVVLKESPQVVIVDIKLSDESGIDLIEKIKNINEGIRVLIFAAYISGIEFNKCEEYGVNGYVMKDALVEDIIFAIRCVERGKKYYDPQVVKTINNKKNDILADLTEREREVMKSIGKGMSNGEIASTLYISESTVKKYVSNIFNKLNFKNRSEVIYFLYHTYETTL